MKLGVISSAILEKIYDKNLVCIKISEGLCQPFDTTVGILQGEANSPLLSNIFVKNIKKKNDDTCN